MHSASTYTQNSRICTFAELATSFISQLFRSHLVTFQMFKNKFSTKRLIHKSQMPKRQFRRLWEGKTKAQKAIALFMLSQRLHTACKASKVLKKPLYFHWVSFQHATLTSAKPNHIILKCGNWHGFCYASHLGTNIQNVLVFVGNIPAKKTVNDIGQSVEPCFTP